MLRIGAFLIILSGTLAAGPAAAQLGAIFGDSPPRPPADIPNGTFAPQPPMPFPGRSPYAAPAAAPAQSAIETQPLPPPPGALAAPRVQPARVVPQGGYPPPRGYPAPQQGYQPPPPPPPTSAPRQPSASPSPQSADVAPPNDMVMMEMPPEKISNTRAVFSGLDKITGRTMSFDAAIGETVQFGALQVTPRICYTRPPTEPSATDAFVEVDEVTLQGAIKRIFTGWMFDSSPGLHAVEHPIYDVWLTGCAGPIAPREPAVAAASPPAPPARPARQRRRRHRQTAPTASTLQPR